MMKVNKVSKSKSWSAPQHFVLSQAISSREVGNLPNRSFELTEQLSGTKMSTFSASLSGTRSSKCFLQSLTRGLTVFPDLVRNRTDPLLQVAPVQSQSDNRFWRKIKWWWSSKCEWNAVTYQQLEIFGYRRLLLINGISILSRAGSHANAWPMFRRVTRR